MNNKVEIGHTGGSASITAMSPNNYCHANGQYHLKMLYYTCTDQCSSLDCKRVTLLVQL